METFRAPQHRYMGASLGASLVASLGLPLAPLLLKDPTLVISVAMLAECTKKRQHMQPKRNSKFMFIKFYEDLLISMIFLILLIFLPVVLSLLCFEAATNMLISWSRMAT